MKNTKVLNPKQQEAILHDTGPLLIIAGAGTGKTTVVTERIKHLILEKNVKPSQILALTFTEKAALEMEERIDITMPYGYTQLWIATFHSFCDRILRNEAVHIGLNPAYKLMSEAETILFLRKNIFKFKLNYFRPLGNPNKFLEGLIQHFSRLRDEDINPQDYHAYAQERKRKGEPFGLTQGKSGKENILNPSPFTLHPDDAEAAKTMELAHAFATYQELKDTEGTMDYADLITNTLRLFRERPNVLRQYQEQFEHVLVDEFQDTNFAQNQLAIMLAGKKRNITVVGDDDQCLPGNTLISTPHGKKKIQNIKKGEEVFTGIGKGSIGISTVTKVFKNIKKTTLISVKTNSGKVLTATHNHKMFCYVPKAVKKKELYYVYLMFRKKLGWRLGITNDLVVRLKLERSSDAIIGLRAFKTEQEARYHELLWSLQFQIPTCIFKERDGVTLQGTYVEKLYKQIDTEKSAILLADHLGIDLKYFHYTLDAVTRSHTERVKINVYQCSREYTVKNRNRNVIVKKAPILHTVHMETSNSKIIDILKENNIPYQKAKKGFRVRISSIDLGYVHKIAEKLVDITGGFIEMKSTIGTLHTVNMPSLIMPLGNVLEGMYLPTVENNRIFYDQVVSVSRQNDKMYVYDLEIEKTHNFIANDVVVHNSIYRWRGAAISNMIQFKTQYPDAKIVTLTQNYRSTQEILDRSYQLITNNNPDRLEAQEKIDKKLTATRKEKEYNIDLLYEERVEDEAECVAQKIMELMKKEKREYKDFAILVRANDHSQPFSRALQRHNIPYQFLGPGRLFKQEEIKDLIAYLKVLYNFEDSISLYRVLTFSLFKLEARDIASLLNFAKRKNLSLFEALERTIEQPQDQQELFIKNESFDKLKIVLEMIKKHLNRVSTDSAGQILYYFLQDSGLLKKFLSPQNEAETKQYQNIAKFFDKLKSFEAEHEDARIFPVVDWIDLSMQMGESPLASDTDWSENNAVNILTIHSSKGLEFPVVFLVNLVSQRFPTRERREQIPIPQELIKEILPTGEYHMQEERRLFYVGMTRARDHLFFTAAKFYGEGKRDRKLSPFVYESLGEKTIDKLVEQQKIQSTAVQTSLLDWVEIANRAHLPTSSSNSLQPTTHNLQPPKLTYISYSQLQCFDMCPLHYKLQYVLKIPHQMTPPLSFGISVHSALKDYYHSWMQENKSEDIGVLLKKKWIDEGYSSKEHQKEAFERAQFILKEYIKENFKPDRAKPLGVEIPFQFVLNLPKRPPLKLAGRIDRVDKLDGNTIEIIDYKTGTNVPDEKDLAKNLQLTLYALAATKVHDDIFRKKPEEVVLSLHYLEEGKKLTTFRTQEQLEASESEILQKIEDIENSDLTCSKTTLCQNCEYKMLCSGL